MPSRHPVRDDLTRSKQDKTLRGSRERVQNPPEGLARSNTTVLEVVPEASETVLGYSRGFRSLDSLGSSILSWENKNFAVEHSL